MCPKLTELLSWNGLTVHVCRFMLARASTKTFVSRIHIRQPSPKKSGKKIFVSRKIRQQSQSLAEVSIFVSRVQKTAKKSSLAEKFVSRVTRQPRYHCMSLFAILRTRLKTQTNVIVRPSPKKVGTIIDAHRGTLFYLTNIVCHLLWARQWCSQTAAINRPTHMLHEQLGQTK